MGDHHRAREQSEPGSAAARRDSEEGFAHHHRARAAPRQQAAPFQNALNGRPDPAAVQGPMEILRMAAGEINKIRFGNRARQGGIIGARGIQSPAATGRIPQVG